MSFFGGKMQVTVATQVSRVIKDNLLPDGIKVGVIKSIMQGGDAISPYVVDELVSGVGVKADRMYEYAARGEYTHGLPSGEIYATTQGKEQIEAILASIEGQDVLIDYTRFGPPNMLHLAWLYLVNNYGYNTTTNELTVLTADKGSAVYLHDMVVCVPSSRLDSYEVGALNQWGPPPTTGFTPERPDATTGFGSTRARTPLFVDTAATEEYVRIEIAYKRTRRETIDGQIYYIGTVKRESIVLPTEPLADEAADYFHVRYKAGAVVKYWMYQAGLGTYPQLDALIDVPAPETGSYYPFAYFRFKKQSEIDDTTTESYRTTKKLVKYLGMDFDQVAQAINDNPDIADVEQAMMYMGVPADSQDPLEQRYLFTYFDNLFQAQGSEWQYRDPKEASMFHDIRLRDDLQNLNQIVIADKRFKMVLRNGGIYKRPVTGSIGPVGAYATQFSGEFYEVLYTQPDSTEVFVKQHLIPFHHYRHQISSNTYEEILVATMEMLYFVDEEFATTSDGSSTKILLIPIDRSITQNYSLPERERLYARSLHFVFNSKIFTKLSWYQSDIFQVIMIFIALVITIISAGSGGGALQAAIAAGSAAAIAAAVINIIIDLVINMVIAAGFKLVAQQLGVDVSIILAVVAMVYGGYQSFAGTNGLAGAPWANQLLQVGTNLIKATVEVIQDQMKDLVGEYQAFAAEKEEANKQLAAANKLLEQNNYLSPMVIFGEKPDDFYNRTVHSGNTGILSISAISSYVDIALTLPKLDDTLGEFKYG